MNSDENIVLEFIYDLAPFHRLVVSDFTGPVAGLHRLLVPLSNTFARVDTQLPNNLFEIDPASVESGSLLIRFLLRCIWEDEEEGLLRLADKIRESKTIQAVKKHPQVMSAFAAVVVTSGIIYVAKQPLSAGLELYDDLQRLIGISEQVEESQEDAIDEVSSILDIDPNDLRRLSLEAQTAQPPSLKAIQKIAAPLSRDRQASLFVGNDRLVRLPREPMIDLANMKKWLKPREELMENARITFHAADIDNRTRWAAVVAEISEKRIPVRLDKNINRVRAYGTRRAIADVLVTWTVDNNLGLIPKQYFVTKLRATDKGDDALLPFVK